LGRFFLLPEEVVHFPRETVLQAAKVFLRILHEVLRGAAVSMR
jgi:hypothetical protein